MAGHSKWANIKHRKGANDAKKGKLYTKLNKEITVAVRQGGDDPDANPRLRIAIQNAKGVNMPKDNIERAIKKASGEHGEEYIVVTYEGYGPYAVALFVECMTDNTNRTVSSVRAIFSKYGGSLGKNGSITFLFDRKGVFEIPIEKISNEEEVMLALIESGAETWEREGETGILTCSMEDFGNVQTALEGINIEPTNAEIRYIPNTTVDLSNDHFIKAMKLIHVLEDNDDVQKVYHNINITDTQYTLLENEV